MVRILEHTILFNTNNSLGGWALSSPLYILLGGINLPKAQLGCEPRVSVSKPTFLKRIYYMDIVPQSDHRQPFPLVLKQELRGLPWLWGLVHPNGGRAWGAVNPGIISVSPLETMSPTNPSDCLGHVNGSRWS